MFLLFYSDSQNSHWGGKWRRQQQLSRPTRM